MVHLLYERCLRVSSRSYVCCRKARALPRVFVSSGATAYTLATAYELATQRNKESNAKAAKAKAVKDCKEAVIMTAAEDEAWVGSLWSA